MRSLLCFSLFFLTLSIGTSAQSDPKEIVSAQKDLRRALIKHTKSVYSVDYSGCSASIKVVTGFMTSTFVPTTSIPPQGFAGFPTDTIGPNFTPEPRALGKSIRYLLELANLDSNNISIRHGGYRNTSVITLRVGDNTGALRTKTGKNIQPADSFVVVTPTKSASKTAAAMKAAIERCSKGS